MGSIPTYTKNWLVSWSDDKELSSRADTISWNSLSKNKIKEKKKKNSIGPSQIFVNKIIKANTHDHTFVETLLSSILPITRYPYLGFIILRTKIPSNLYV